jgi:hypothetical protein
VIEHAPAWNWDRKRSRNLCYETRQLKQVHEHQCKEAGKKMWIQVVSTASTTCAVKPEHSIIKPYGNTLRICRTIQIFSASYKPHLLMRGIQMWEMSKLDMYLSLLSVSIILVSSQSTLWPSTYACCGHFDFSRRLCLCSRSLAARGLTVLPNSQRIP